MVGAGAVEPDDDRSRLPTGIEFARELVRRQVREPAPPTRQLADALHRTCESVFSNVRLSMGDDGCRALFGRAFSAVHDQHPAIETLRVAGDCEIPRERLLAAIETHGASATTSAVEALLAALVDILARLIGADMTIRILDPGTSTAERADGESP